MIVILMALILSKVAAETPGDSLTLSQSINLALDNNPTINQGVSGISISDAQIEQSQSAFYPDISLSGSYTRLDPVSTFELLGLGNAELSPHNNYNANLIVKQTVFDFGRRSRALELAQSGRSSATENVEAQKSNLAYQMVDIFYAILYLRENLTVLDSQLIDLHQHLEITRKKASAGTATDFEILTTEVRIANTNSQKLDLNNALQDQETFFRQLTGLRPEIPVTLKGDFTAPLIEIDEDSLISAAYEQLPEMQMAKIAESGAMLQEKLASLGDKPTVGLNISLGYKNGFEPDIDEVRANWAATVGLQVPIFNGFLTRGKVRQARANHQAALYRIDDIKRRATAGIEQAISWFSTSKSKLQNSEPQVRQAEEAVKLAHTRYDAGTATNLDLLDAETALANARLIRLKAMYDLVRSSYSLEKASGAKIWE